MPENLYFRQPDTQRMLLDVLFIFCKLNPDLSYRQGMHEILAPILWVVERDSIELGESSKTLGEDSLVKAVFDAEYIEHDAFALFGQVMQSAKNFYEQTTTSGRENPMVARSRRIFNEMLSMVDSRLAKHLDNIEIVPQIFLMRWIRLLFGREFAFDDMLTVWDVIFAEDTSLEIVDHISLAMLLRIHWDLIEADYNAALTLLLKYPEPGSSIPAQTFVLDALYLREHMDQHSGSHLVSKYTGRPLQEGGRPVTPPALQRNITTFSGSNTGRTASANGSSSAPRSSFQTRNLETVLQSTAKNIYARGEKLGIGKAVRSAVDEVHRKAQEIRDHQTPSPPVVRRPRGSRPVLGSDSPQSRAKLLQDRSQQLGKLLESAVSELWEYQKIAAESSDITGKSGDTMELERLSVAIAKVQFVQVYLDDPKLPLPAESDETETAAAQTQESLPSAVPAVQVERTSSGSRERSSLQTHSGTGGNPPDTAPTAEKDDSRLHEGELADPSTFEDLDQSSPQAEKDAPAPVNSRSTRTEAAPDNSRATSKSPIPSISRPRMEQSGYSWMLGEGTADTGPFRKPSSLSQDKARDRNLLFGNNDGDSRSGSKDRGGGRDPRKKPASTAMADNDEVFDLSSLRHGKGKAT